MDQILNIYCNNPSKRHTYVFDLVFKSLLGVSYCYTTDWSGVHINYSSENGNGIKIVPHGLLSEKDIRNTILDEVIFESWKDTSVFFRTSDTSTPYDIFSAIFFLVTRYEEYLPFRADIHGRFPAEESVLFKNGALERPLVNQWVKILKNMLEETFTISFPQQRFTYKSTIDIDQAWKYNNKGLLRNILGAIRDLMGLNIRELIERFRVFQGSLPDPYFNFNWQQKVHQEYQIDVTYFILLGQYGKYDKNIPPNNKYFVKLIKQLFKSSSQQVGIHPSYISNKNFDILKKEYETMQSLSNIDIDKSRQHYLIHSMPKTYHDLIRLGISQEYTMGYSTHMGFRAGIAAPFLWFDLTINSQTNLKLLPFCIMDITPLYYRQETPDIAIKTIQGLMKSVHQVEGLFISLWHNDSLGESDRWKGWRRVYQNMIKLANSYETLN